MAVTEEATSSLMVGTTEAAEYQRSSASNGTSFVMPMSTLTSNGCALATEKMVGVGYPHSPYPSVSEPHHRGLSPADFRHSPRRPLSPTYQTEAHYQQNAPISS